MPTILIAGDFAPRERVKELIETGKTSKILESVRPYIDNSDYSILNFESTIEVKGHEIKKCGPHLGCDAHAVSFIKEQGFDCVSLANNHILDYGAEGLEQLIVELDRLHIDHMGAGQNLQEAQSHLIVDIEGVKVAFVNICEHEFSIASYKASGAAPIDPVANYRQIAEARKIANRVVVITHGGNEHYQFPSPRMKDLYHAFIEWGADAVVNHHQHCYSGYEIYQGRPIFYGLGNFCFDNQKRNGTGWNKGYFVLLKFDCLNDAEVAFDIVNYVQCVEQAAVVVSHNMLNLDSINKIIADDELLLAEWYRFTEQRSRRLLVLFSSLRGRLFRFLARKKFVPIMLSTTWMLKYLNLLECEAQRDITIAALKKEINNEDTK